MMTCRVVPFRHGFANNAKHGAPPANSRQLGQRGSARVPVPVSSSFLAVSRRRGRQRHAGCLASLNTDLPSPPATGDDIRARFRKRVLHDLVEAAVREGRDRGSFNKNLSMLENLVPGFSPDPNTLKESDWVELIADAGSVARKIIRLKTCFPTLDIVDVMAKKPKTFLLSDEHLKTASEQVAHLLAEAEDPGAIISATPDLLDPAMVASVLVSFQRWFRKEDPIQVLQERGASVLERAQQNDVPLDPVYFDGKSWKAPAFDTQAKQLPWQEHVRTKVNGLPPLNKIDITPKYKPQ